MPGLWLSFAAICGLVATLMVVKQQPRAASLDPLLEP